VTATFSATCGICGGHCYFYALLAGTLEKVKPKSLKFDKRQIHMTEDERKLLQAKHRLEEAQVRDRVKERKARTRRLIQEGAILEKAFPQAADMGLDCWRITCVDYENERITTWRRSGKPGRFFFLPEGRTYSPLAMPAVAAPAGLVRSLRRGAGCGVFGRLTDFQSEERLLLPGGSNRFPFSNPYAFTRARSKARGREPRRTLDDGRR
jgi:hypothetical protein